MSDVTPFPKSAQLACGERRYRRKQGRIAEAVAGDLGGEDYPERAYGVRYER